MFLTCPHRHSHRLSQCPGPCVRVCVSEKGRVRHWNPALVLNQHGRMMCDPLTSQDFCCCLTIPSKPLTVSDKKYNKIKLMKCPFAMQNRYKLQNKCFCMHICHKYTHKLYVVNSLTCTECTCAVWRNVPLCLAILSLEAFECGSVPLHDKIKQIKHVFTSHYLHISLLNQD